MSLSGSIGTDPGSVWLVVLALALPGFQLLLLLLQELLPLVQLQLLVGEVALHGLQLDQLIVNFLSNEREGGKIWMGDRG